jgi:hypothetical protein
MKRFIRVKNLLPRAFERDRNVLAALSLLDQNMKIFSSRAIARTVSVRRCSRVIRTLPLFTLRAPLARTPPYFNNSNSQYVTSQTRSLHL